MNSDSYPYPHRKQLTIAGCLALVTLITAVIYEWHSTPYTMIIFLMGGSIALLVAVLIFSWTLWKDLRARLESIVTRQVAPGEIVFRQGDAAEHVFVITKGEVEAVHSDPAKGDVILSRLGVDEVFGEAAILSRSPRQATVRALGAVELLSIHRNDFLQMYASLPRLRARLQAQQARRLALVNKSGGAK